MTRPWGIVVKKAKPGLNLTGQKKEKKMKARRICTRTDELSKDQRKDLRSRINETVEDFNKELESQDSESQED